MIYPRRGKNFSYAHITGRTQESEWPELPMDLVWEIFAQHLTHYAKPGGAQINAFVLMGNHFHLLLMEEISKITISCERLAKHVEDAFEGFTGDERPVFDSTPDQFLISDHKHLRQVYRYIYQNPVKAGVARRAENYRYSTLGPLLGRQNDLSPMPVMDTFGIIYDPIRLLKWINDTEENEKIWYAH